MIPALGRQRQADLSEFEASLVYRVSSRTTRTVTERNPVSKNKTKQNKKSQTNPTHMTMSFNWFDCRESKHKRVELLLSVLSYFGNYTSRT